MRGSQIIRMVRAPEAIKTRLNSLVHGRHHVQRGHKRSQDCLTPLPPYYYINFPHFAQTLGRSALRYLAASNVRVLTRSCDVRLSLSLSLPLSFVRAHIITCTIVGTTTAGYPCQISAKAEFYGFTL